MPDVFKGEFRLFAGNFVPEGWLACNGRRIDGRRAEALKDALRGGFDRRDDGTFVLPDLRSRALVGIGKSTSGPPPPSELGLGEVGDAIAVRGGDDPASLGLTYLLSPRTDPDEPMTGEIRVFAFDFAPPGWLLCDGRFLDTRDEERLFKIVGRRFGRDGDNRFAIPDLRGFTPVGRGDSDDLPATDLSERRRGLAPVVADEQPARLHLTHCIAKRDREIDEPREYYIGECRPFGGEIPNNWSPCDGRLISARSEPGFAAVIGNRFGGDGIRTIALPDLRGRATAGTDPDGGLPLGATSGRRGGDPSTIPFAAARWAIATRGVFPSPP